MQSRDLFKQACNGDEDALMASIRMPRAVPHKKNWTCLHIAAVFGYVKAIHAAIAAGFNINAIDINMRTPLFIAIRHKQIYAVESLIELGANVNLADSDNMSPLHAALTYGIPEVVDALIGSGADINAIDIYHRTPLYCAARFNHPRAVESLNKADVDVNLAPNFRHPILIAAACGHVEIIKLLADIGADVDAPDNCMQTAMHLAAMYGTAETIETLVKIGANINARSEFRCAPLYCCQINSMPVVRALIDGGASRVMTSSYSFHWMFSRTEKIE